MARSQIKVEGLREVQRELRKLKVKELDAEMRAANKEAGQIVETEAERQAPEKSGKLKASIGVRASTRNVQVKAGTAQGVPYAGPIHFGWPGRSIRPQPFLFHAAGVKAKQVREAFEKRLDALSTKFSSRR